MAVVFVIGLAAGATSVLFGHGGGVVIVPTLLIRVSRRAVSGDRRHVARHRHSDVAPEPPPHARLGTINRKSS